MDLNFVLTTFALSDNERATAQRLYDDLTAGHPAPAPAELGLIIQAVTSAIEIERTQRGRAAIAAEKLRRSTLDFEFQRLDEHLEHRSLFNKSCFHAIMYMKRTPLGLRHMIERWEHLEGKLAEDGTWYSADRILAIGLSGLSAVVDELYLSEEAYGIWRDALAAQPAPKQSDINVVVARDVIPKSLQDRNTVVWPVDPGEARARLHALVERSLAMYRPMEEWLRENIEEPEKAAIDERALACVTPEDQRLLQALRSHQQSFERATAALEKLRRRSAAATARQRPAPREDVGVAELDPALFNPQDCDWPATAPATAPAPAPAARDMPVRPQFHHTDPERIDTSRRPRSLPAGSSPAEWMESASPNCNGCALPLEPAQTDCRPDRENWAAHGGGPPPGRLPHAAEETPDLR